MVDSAREVCGSVRVGGKNKKSVWWLNDGAKVSVKRKESAWKEMLGGRDDVIKEGCMETYKEEKKG